jgi:hypothetical protein
VPAARRRKAWSTSLVDQHVAHVRVVLGVRRLVGVGVLGEQSDAAGLGCRGHMPAWCSSEAAMMSIGRLRELLGQALRGGHACDPIDERRAVQRYLGGVRQLPQRPRRSAASVKAHRFTGFWHPVAWAVLVQGATPSTRSVKVAAVRFG